MLVTEHLIEFLGKNPQNIKEWKQDSNNISVVLGVFSKTITESVRTGVLLALNDAFGNKK